jgi:flagellar FliL protein
VLSIGTALAYAYVLRDGKTAEPSASTKLQEKPIFVALEPMTVNLQSEGERAKFVHLGVVLKVRDEKAKAQITEFMPELRSRILLLLSNRQPGSLMSPEDKSRLTDEIRAEFNRPLATGSPSQGVVSVSFNTFVVQ